MLELKDVSITLIKGCRKIIEGFNFSLNPGDKAVIIGEEGNGKSTLLKFINDKDSVSGYCQCSGQVIMKGRLGYLPQALPDEYADLSLKEFFKDYDPGLHNKILVRLNLGNV